MVNHPPGTHMTRSEMTAMMASESSIADCNPRDKGIHAKDIKMQKNYGDDFHKGNRGCSHGMLQCLREHDCYITTSIFARKVAAVFVSSPQVSLTDKT